LHITEVARSGITSYDRAKVNQGQLKVKIVGNAHNMYMCADIKITPYLIEIFYNGILN
jgi:hypothetical protein